LGTKYKETVYEPRLEAGIQFQDFVCVELHKLGIILQNMSSKKYQRKKENLLGLEIKFDRRFRETGNLYIETHEKSDPSNPEYVKSGIYRDDETWLFGIGDEQTFFIFAKTLLRNFVELSDSLTWLKRAKPTPTSMGVLFPLAKARQWAARVVEFGPPKQEPKQDQ